MVIVVLPILVNSVDKSKPLTTPSLKPVTVLGQSGHPGPFHIWQLQRSGFSNAIVGGIVGSLVLASNNITSGAGSTSSRK